MVRIIPKGIMPCGIKFIKILIALSIGSLWVSVAGGRAAERTTRLRPVGLRGAGEYGIIRASEIEQHHALYCAVRRFRRAGGGRARHGCRCSIYRKNIYRRVPFIPELAK